MRAKDLDEIFDNNKEDIIDFLDLSKATRPNKLIMIEFKDGTTQSVRRCDLETFIIANKNKLATEKLKTITRQFSLLSED